MFASCFVRPLTLSFRVSSRWLLDLVVGSIALVATGQAIAAPACEPVLGFTEVRFSKVQLETMERRWTALMSVDASRCASTSGHFEILFARQKENAPEVDFVERFVWAPGVVEVSVDFWVDEAVEGYWISSVAACPCRD